MFWLNENNKPLIYRPTCESLLDDRTTVYERRKRNRERRGMKIRKRRRKKKGSSFEGNKAVIF